MSFASLGLSEALVSAVEAAGYAQPTPVQQRAIPAVLQKRDLMVAAQTGTGKTAGFALPVLELLFPAGVPNNTISPLAPHQVRVLVLTPTRELAAQVHDSFRLYARQLPLKSACIFGGVGMTPQIKALAQGVDVLVACPGRLLDLASQKGVDLSKVDVLILDEADRMLDMGFIHDVKRVLAQLPARRQNLLFSATFSKDILALANRLLQDPERIEVTPPNTTVERIQQHVYRVASGLKRALLAHLIAQGQWEQVLVFTRTKHGANRLAEYLEKRGLTAAAIHGNKSQNARTRALADFKSAQIRVLVATDIAARGLDIDQLPHVVNFELPNVEEDYVHRIGRTGRAGRDGEAISLVSPEEEKLLRNIERLIQWQIPNGDWMGFDAAALEQEKEVALSRTPMLPSSTEQNSPAPSAPNATKSPRLPRKPRAAAASTERSVSAGHKAGANRHPKRERDSSHASARAVSSPLLRDPEEFLDDDVDNFGNRVDYVSPYQNQTKGHGRKPNYQGAVAKSAGTSGGARGTGAGSGRVPTAKPSASSTNGTQGAAHSSKAPRAQQASAKPPRSANPRRPGRSYGQERQLTPFERTASAEPAVKSRKPLIVRKESKLDRLPTLEQLEQLDRQQPSAQGRGATGEKPVLLKRNL